MGRLFALAGFTLLVPSVALASDEQAENHLVDAVVAYREQAWDEAFAALDRARTEVGSDALSAKIERQMALVLIATDEPVAGLEAFRAAVRLDPEIQLPTWRFGPAVTTLFACAQQLDPAFPTVEQLQSDGARGWLCPSSQTDAPTPIPEAIVVPQTAASSTSADVEILPRAEVPPSVEEVRPAQGTFSALGGVGVGLIVAGLGGGGALAGWQALEAQARRDEVDEFDAMMAADTETARNDADRARVDAERNAIIAASVGGGVALTGLVLLIIDLADRPSEPPLVSIGPTGASFLVRF